MVCICLVCSRLGVVFAVVVLRKLVVFGVTELDKNEQASAFMKLVFERLAQFLNASMCYPEYVILTKQHNNNKRQPEVYKEPCCS